MNDNETDPLWLVNTDDDTKGTGVFAFDPDSNFGPTVGEHVVDNPAYGSIRKGYVRDINYVECCKRGRKAIVFSWVPHNVAGQEAVEKRNVCGGRCVLRCARPGCLCIGGVCQ